MSFCRACGKPAMQPWEGGPHRRCAACGAMEWVNPAPAVGLAVVDGGRVLLSRRARPPHAGLWDLIGGFLEPGETPEEGLRREVAEETGCRLAAVQVLDVEPGTYDGRPTLNFLAAGRLEGKPVAQDDSLELAWHPLDALPQMAWTHEAAFLHRLASRGAELAPLAWPEAKLRLRPDAVVLLPLGAAAKEHGPHLPLETDRLLAEALATLVLAQAGPEVVQAPTLTDHHYPAFAAYPGSTSLSAATARDLVVDIVRSLSAHGPRRFYVLNTGLSTVGPLQDAAAELAKDGIRLAWTDWEGTVQEVHRKHGKQPRGGHADEWETSLMLHLAPHRVEMAKAVREVAEWKPGGFHTFSPSGVWGDATIATPEKGGLLCDALVARVLADLGALRAAQGPAGLARL